MLLLLSLCQFKPLRLPFFLFGQVLQEGFVHAVEQLLNIQCYVVKLCHVLLMSLPEFLRKLHRNKLRRLRMLCGLQILLCAFICLIHCQLNHVGWSFEWSLPGFAFLSLWERVLCWLELGALSIWIRFIWLLFVWLKVFLSFQELVSHLLSELLMYFKLFLDPLQRFQLSLILFHHGVLHF